MPGRNDIFFIFSTFSHYYNYFPVENRITKRNDEENIKVIFL